MSPWGLISIGRWQRDREARCKNISCARGLEVGVWLLPTFPHAELRWSHLIVRAARDHYSAVCLEGRRNWFDESWLVFAELSNEKLLKILLYPFSFLCVPWLTGNLFLTSVLWFCSLLVFQMRSWTVPQMSLYKYVFMVCVCRVDQPSHPYSVTKVEDKEKKVKITQNLFESSLLCWPAWPYTRCLSCGGVQARECDEWLRVLTLSGGWLAVVRGRAAGLGSALTGVVGRTPRMCGVSHCSSLNVLCLCWYW